MFIINDLVEKMTARVNPSKSFLFSKARYPNVNGSVRLLTVASVLAANLSFANTVLAATVTPSVPVKNSWWHPKPGLKWQIQYTGTHIVSPKINVYNFDLFETTAKEIAQLHAKKKKVICYFSAGSYEDWRPDAKVFPASVRGKPLDDWEGESWLDVRQAKTLVPIMRNRMRQAAKKGCDAVDPDNVDGYKNDTGFPISYIEQLSYNRALAIQAHKLNLAISLKNDLEQINDLVKYFDFAVNEQCFQWNECPKLKPFIKAKKPVLGIEYYLLPAKFCAKANAMNFDFLQKKLELDVWRKSCR
jgi:hypothetical protein